MPDEKATSRWFRLMVVSGRLLIGVGLVWAIVLLLSTGDTKTAVVTSHRETAIPTAPAGLIDSDRDVAATPLITWSAPVLYDRDLGTRSVEFSAVTLNESTNRLMIADDEGRLFEFDLADNGDLIAPPRRTIQVDVGDTDIEGIAWIRNTTYVLAHEADGVLSVVDIPEGLRAIGEQQRLSTIETGIVGSGGNGIEGVAVSLNGDAAFVVVVEKPPSLRFIDEAGSTERVVPLQVGVVDVSDVWAAPDGTIWIVSDESAVVVHLEVGADGIVKQRQRVDLVFAVGEFPQAEGVVMSRDGTRLYVVGEGSARGEFTVAFWQVSPA